MREIIFKYKLKSKKDGEIINVLAPLYNEKNGTMQFPIELDKWEVLEIKQCLDKKDIHDKTICEGNLLRFKSITYNNREFEGIVKWNDFTNGFYIDREFDIGFSFNSDIFDIEIIE